MYISHVPIHCIPDTNVNPTLPSFRNLALLSFGEDAAEEEEAPAAAKAKIKSAHDILDEKRLLRDDSAGDDAQLVSLSPRGL
jgi:peptidyl-prolyl cis-trans isomerase SDCCAG10